jgi:hypothetical protein
MIARRTTPNAREVGGGRAAAPARRSLAGALGGQMTIRAHGEMSTHRKAPPARRVWIMCMCSAVLLAIGVRWSFRHQWSDVGLGLMFSAMRDVPATTV